MFRTTLSSRVLLLLLSSMLGGACDRSGETVARVLAANAIEDHAQACSLATDALSRGGASTEATAFLRAAAESCLHADNLAAANTVFERALALDPAATWPRSTREQFNGDAPTGDAAIARHREVLADDPNNVEANHAIALELVARGAFADALPYARLAAAYQRNQTAVRGTYALALAGADQPDEAVQQLQLMADRELPDLERAALLSAVAAAFARAGQTSRSRELYQGALEFDGQNAEALKAVAAQLLSRQQWDDAIALLEPALETVPDPSIPALLSLAFSGAGFPTDAENAARRAQQAGHHNLATVWQKVSEAYAASGLPNDAARTAALAR